MIERVFLSALGLCLALASFGLCQRCAAEESAAVREDRLFCDVKYLASDELEGRGVGTAGLNKAADYIAAQFSKIGLKTDTFDGSPFQKFETATDAELGPPEKNQLTFVRSGLAKEASQAAGALPEANGASKANGKAATTDRIELKLGADFNTLALGGSNEFSAPLVFVGYAISADEEGLKYDDFADIKVRDKVAIIVRKTPRQADPANPFGGVHSHHAFFTTKIDNAAKHGAAAVIVVNDDYNLRKKSEENADQWRKAIDELIEAERTYRDKADGSPEAFDKHRDKIVALAEKVGKLGKSLSSSPDELVPFNGAGESDKHPKMPVFFATRAAIEPVIQAALGQSLAEIEAKIDETLKPQSRELSGWLAEGEASLKREKVEVKNVVGVLEGKGPKANETLVIGAHYDHLGWGGSGSLAPWTHEIHNGADDNASGTAALIEVARELAARPEPPARRIVFIAFTGEERGLLGSAQYVRNPPFPLETTVAMLNMDMVGRLKDNELVVYGTGSAAEFDALVDRLNGETQFKIVKKPEGIGPSDHTSFYQKKIPVLHLFTNSHKDYHRPSDDYDKINVEGMRRVTDLMVNLANAVASADERPEYRETRSPRTARAGNFPYFGSIPDYAAAEQGAALSGVQPDSPAAKAGLQAGDVIIRFGKADVSNVEDFAAALGSYKAGDTVEVAIRRSDKTITVNVTLEKRK